MKKIYKPSLGWGDPSVRGPLTVPASIWTCTPRTREELGVVGYACNPGAETAQAGGSVGLPGQQAGFTGESQTLVRDISS